MVTSNQHERCSSVELSISISKNIKDALQGCQVDTHCVCMRERMSERAGEQVRGDTPPWFAGTASLAEGKLADPGSCESAPWPLQLL